MSAEKKYNVAEDKAELSTLTGLYNACAQFNIDLVKVLLETVKQKGYNINRIIDIKDENDKVVAQAPAFFGIAGLTLTTYWNKEREMLNTEAVKKDAKKILTAKKDIAKLFKKVEGFNPDIFVIHEDHGVYGFNHALQAVVGIYNLSFGMDTTDFIQGLIKKLNVNTEFLNKISTVGKLITALWVKIPEREALLQAQIAMDAKLKLLTADELKAAMAKDPNLDLLTDEQLASKREELESLPKNKAGIIETLKSKVQEVTLLKDALQPKLLAEMKLKKEQNPNLSSVELWEVKGIKEINNFLTITSNSLKLISPSKENESDDLKKSTTSSSSGDKLPRADTPPTKNFGKGGSKITSPKSNIRKFTDVDVVSTAAEVKPIRARSSSAGASSSSIISGSAEQSPKTSGDNSPDGSLVNSTNFDSPSGKTSLVKTKASRNLKASSKEKLETDDAGSPNISSPKTSSGSDEKTSSVSESSESPRNVSSVFKKDKSHISSSPVISDKEYFEAEKEKARLEAENNPKLEEMSKKVKEQIGGQYDDLRHKLSATREFRVKRDKTKDDYQAIKNIGITDLKSGITMNTTEEQYDKIREELKNKKASEMKPSDSHTSSATLSKSSNGKRK
jgi:hypothetical protein